MVVAVTGASGNMGTDTVAELLKIPEITTLRILGHRRSTTEKLLRKHHRSRNRFEVLYGNIGFMTAVFSAPAAPSTVQRMRSASDF